MHVYLFYSVIGIHVTSIYLPPKKNEWSKVCFRSSIAHLVIIRREKKLCSLIEIWLPLFFQENETTTTKKTTKNNSWMKKEHFIERHHKIRYHSKIIKTLWNWEECEKLFDAIRNLISILPLCNAFALSSYACIHHIAGLQSHLHANRSFCAPLSLSRSLNVAGDES